VSDGPTAGELLGPEQLGPWSDSAAQAARWLIRRALEEDLGDRGDLTTDGLLPAGARGAAQLVTRQAGVICGLAICRLIVDEFARDLRLETRVEDGARVDRGAVLATIRGSARELLMYERTCLNFLGRLSGVASLTARFVDAVTGTKARILDTRKTTPGWRLLEKYAVRCGGGDNHRLGLFDGVLIKDNHIALCEHLEAGRIGIAEAVARSRTWVRQHVGASPDRTPVAIEVEVDSLEQLRAVVAERPDIVLLDNMPVAELRKCVEFRDARAPHLLLEASGGIGLDHVAAVASTGVDRISVGALTHSATNFDVGLDWVPWRSDAGRQR
jgi:nicotinate-nucleotide pyrophosphorylase (carboxylating)